MATKPRTRRFCCTVPLGSAGPAPLSPSPPCCPSSPCRLAASFRHQRLPQPGVNQHIPSDPIQQTSYFSRPKGTRRERRALPPQQLRRRLAQTLAISSARRSTGCGISVRRWRRLRSKSLGSLIASGRHGGRAHMMMGRVGVRRQPCSRGTSARRSTYFASLPEPAAGRRLCSGCVKRARHGEYSRCLRRSFCSSNNTSTMCSSRFPR